MSSEAAAGTLAWQLVVASFSAESACCPPSRELEPTLLTPLPEALREALGETLRETRRKPSRSLFVSSLKFIYRCACAVQKEHGIKRNAHTRVSR